MHAVFDKTSQTINAEGQNDSHYDPPFSRLLTFAHVVTHGTHTVSQNGKTISLGIEPRIFRVEDLGEPKSDALPLGHKTDNKKWPYRHIYCLVVQKAQLAAIGISASTVLGGGMMLQDGSVLTGIDFWYVRQRVSWGLCEIRYDLACLWIKWRFG